MLEHGGRLLRAVHQYGIAREHWLDLSSGIAPWAFPIPPSPVEAWARLPETEDGLAIEDGVGLGLADEPSRVRRELPLDPASLSPLFIDLLSRGLDQRKALRCLAATPGEVIDREQRAVQLLEHLGDSLVALVTTADVSLTHPVRHRLPGIAAGRENHQREQTGRGQAEGLALDEAHLNQGAWLGELIAVARLQGVGHAHRPARSVLSPRLDVSNVGNSGQGATPYSDLPPAFLTSNQIARQDTTSIVAATPKRSG